MALGERIKELRKKRKITLADMAEKTELSLGFLSNVEREQTSPTIANLHKICAVLGITLNDLLLENQSIATGESFPEGVTVVRANERRILFSQNDGELCYTSLTSGDTFFKGSAMTISGSELYSFGSHDHDEFGIVFEGILELKILDRSYYLYPGDSIYLKAGVGHSGRRASENPCVSFWFKKGSAQPDDS